MSEVKTDNKNSMIQQLVTNSNLTGQALESYKAELEKLNESQLQAKLSESLNGNKASTDTQVEGLALEHNSDAVEKDKKDDDKDATTSTDADGNEIAETKENGQTIKKVITSKDKKTVTTIEYKDGKPTKKTVKKDGNTVESTTFEYTEKDGSEQVKITATGADKSKTVTTASGVDESGNVPDGKYIAQTKTNMAGATTTMTVENGHIKENNAPADTEAQTQNDVTEKTVGNKVIQYKDGVISKSVETGSDGMIAREYKKYNIGGVEYTGIQTARLVNGRTENNVVLVKNIDEDGNYSDNDIVSNTLYNWNNKVSKVIYYTNGKVSSTKTYGADEKPTSQSTYEYIPTGVVRTTTDENGTVRVIADSVDNSGNLNGIKEQITRHTAGDGIVVLAKDNNKETVLTLKKVNEDFTYNNTDITNKKEITAFQDYTDDDVPEKEKTNNALQKVINYMSTSNHVGKLTYDKSAIRNMFSSLGKEGSDYVRDDKNSTSDYTRYIRKGDDEGEIYVRNSREIKYGMTSVNDNSSEYLYTMNTGNGIRKLYNFKANGTFNGVETINDNKNSHKSVISYDDGSSDVMEYENGHEKKKLHYNTKGQFEYSREMNWKDGNTLDSTIYTYSEYASDPKLRNTQVVDTPKGDSYVYNLDGTLKKRVMRDSVPILNKNNEVVGYAPISEMDIDANGRVTNIPHASIKYLNNGTLNAGEHFDYSQIDNDLRDTALSQLEQGYQAAIDVLESRKEGDSVLNTSYWLNEAAELFDGGTDGYIKHLKQKKAEIEQMKSRFVHGVQHGSDGDITDTSAQALRKSHGQDSSAFAAEYKKLTGKDWNNEERQKYLKFNLDTQKMQLDLQRVYDEYKKNGKLSTSAQATFNILTDGQYMQGDSKKLLKQFIKEVDGTKQKNGSVNPMASGVGSFAYGKLLEKNKSNLGNAQSDMNNATNNDKNLRDTGNVLDVLGCVLEFGLVAKGIQYAGKGIKAVSTLANVGKVAKYTARAGEFLSSELRSARVINSALHAGKDALNMAATMGTFDAASVLGNQVVTGKYDLGEVKEKGLHGAVTGAIGGAVMHYISPQIMKMYKPESTEFEDAVANLAEKAQKAGKTLTASDIAKVTSRVQMPKPTSIRGIGTILADLGANAGVFTGASATVSAFDDSEIRKMLKDSGAYTDAEIKGMSKKDLMRESLKMQGVDTDNMSDFDLTTKYFANEYENQFKGLGQMKIAEYVMAGITKHLQGGALTLGKRASNLEYEYKEGNWYKKGDKSKTPVPTEYMSAEVKQAMAYDALEARLNNRFNKYSKSPMNGREFMGMIYGQQLPEGMETKVAEGLTINIKDGKYEITDANGKTQTVDNIEGIIEAYQNGLAEAYKDDISQKIWDNFEQNNSALDKISQDAKPRTVHIKTDEKYSELKSDLTQKLQSATTGADLTALQAQVDVIQNRDMRREFSHMVDARRAEINPQFDITDLASVQKAEPQKLFAPKTATNIANQGISFKQAPNQPDYTATRIEWGKTVEETIALNKKNGINLELVKDNDGSYYLGIKDVWSDGYHRVDRNAVVMHYGDYNPSETSVNAEWAKVHSDADGKIQDCAVVANDEGARILENSYVTADGQKIDFATMKPGTAVHKDPNAVVNAVAYDKPQTVHTLEGDITTDVTMGDVDGNAYNNFKQLKKQITKGQLVANDADPNSAKFIQLVKDGKDAEALALLRQATAKSAQGTAKRRDVKPEIKLGAVATSSDLMASDVTTPTEGRSKVSAETLGTVGKDGQRIFSKDDYNKLKSEDKNVRQMPDGTVITIDAKGRTIELGKVAKANPTATAQTSATETHTDNGPIKPSKKDPFGIHGVISDEYLNQTKGTLLVKKGDDYVLSPEADKIVFDAAKQIEKVAQQAEPSIVDYMINGGFATKETLSHRCKSAQSLHDKIQNALIDDKSGTLTLEKAINKVKDSVGVRTVNPISDIANDPRVQKFVKAGDMKSARMMAVEIESDYVLQALRHYVDLKAEGKTDMELTRISNYIGEDGIPYFTENQLHQLKVYADKKGVNMPVVERVARPSEQKDAQTGTYNDGSTTKVRESGYTALQMNFRTKDGLTYEWQYRGEALNKFAEGEHVPYDLRTNKDIIGVHTELTRLYEPMKELLTNKEKMSDEQYTEYNHYLTAHYDYLRMHELGFNDGKNPPNLPKGFDARLRAENLELLHQTAEDIKKDPEHEEKYRKEYEANLVQNTADNVTTESYTKAAEARRANRTVDQYEAKARLDMNENENDVNDIIEHCKSNDGQIRDNLVSVASSLGYMGVKPKDVMKLLDIMKNENIDSVSKEIKDLKAKNNNADIDTVVNDYINSDRVKENSFEYGADADLTDADATTASEANTTPAKAAPTTDPNAILRHQIANAKNENDLQRATKQIQTMPDSYDKKKLAYQLQRKSLKLQIETTKYKSLKTVLKEIDDARDLESLNNIKPSVSSSSIYALINAKKAAYQAAPNQDTDAAKAMRNITRTVKGKTVTFTPIQIAEMQKTNVDIAKLQRLAEETMVNQDGQIVPRYGIDGIYRIAAVDDAVINKFKDIRIKVNGKTTRLSGTAIATLSKCKDFDAAIEMLDIIKYKAYKQNTKTIQETGIGTGNIVNFVNKGYSPETIQRLYNIKWNDGTSILNSEEIAKLLEHGVDVNTAEKLLNFRGTTEKGDETCYGVDQVITMSKRDMSLIDKLASRTYRDKDGTVKKRFNNNEIYSLSAFNIPDLNKFMEKYDYYSELTDKNGNRIFNGRNGRMDEASVLGYMASLPDASKEATAVRQLTSLVQDGQVSAHTLKYLPQEGHINPLITQDVRTFYDAYLNHIPLNDVLVPTRESLGDTADLATGDVFEVKGDKNIYIKNQDGTTTQLQMDKATYCKLFPPIERYASTQNGIGNCWQITGFNGLMREPTERRTVLETIKQDGNDIVIHFPNGKLDEIRFKDGKLPDGLNPKFYSEGALGINMLEYAQGCDMQKDVIDNKYNNLQAKLKTATTERERNLIIDQLAQLSTEDFSKIILGGKVYFQKSKNHSGFDFASTSFRNFGSTTWVWSLLGYKNITELSTIKQENETRTFLTNPENFKTKIVSIGTRGRGEIEVNQKKGINSGHAYWIRPNIDASGKIKDYELLNPWGIAETTLTLDEVIKYGSSLAMADKKVRK